MKTVRLPIYEGDIELNERLEVSIELFQKLGATSIIYKDHVKIVPNTPPVDALWKQEIETIDRIIHDLPPHPTLLPKEIVSFQEAGLFYIGESLRQGEPVRVEWRVIPGFAKYRMSTSKAIVEDFTDMEVSISLGRLNNVLLSDDNGVMKRMAVDHLFAKTFPELSK